MRTNLTKLLDLLIFCSLEFFITIFFVTNQLNTSLQTTYLFTFGISGSCVTTWEWKWGTLHQKKFCDDKVHPETDKGGFQLEFVSTYKTGYKSHDLL